MRKFALALAAIAAIGISLPLATPAHAAKKVVIIKQGRDHHRDRGWHHRDHHKKVVIIKRGRHHR